LSIIWSRSWTVIVRDDFAVLRIFTADEINFALIFFDIFCVIDGIYKPAPQDAIGIPHKELNESVVFDPTGIPKASPAAC
jgi:hypothetical protein